MYVDKSWQSLDPIYLSLLQSHKFSDNFSDMDGFQDGGYIWAQGVLKYHLIEVPWGNYFLDTQYVFSSCRVISKILYWLFIPLLKYFIVVFSATVRSRIYSWMRPCVVLVHFPLQVWNIWNMSFLYAGLIHRNAISFIFKILYTQLYSYSQFSQYMSTSKLHGIFKNEGRP